MSYDLFLDSILVTEDRLGIRVQVFNDIRYFNMEYWTINSIGRVAITGSIPLLDDFSLFWHIIIQFPTQFSEIEETVCEKVKQRVLW